MASFTAICFADLKRYKFTYLFAFPALHSEPPWKLVRSTSSKAASEEAADGDARLVVHMTGQETAALVDSVQTWRYRVDSRQHGFFLAKKQRASFPEGMMTRTEEESSHRSTIPGTPGGRPGFTWVIESLTDFENGFFDGIPQEDRYVCFTDPSTYPEYPGWMLRNLLVLIRRRWKLEKVQVLCYRDVHARRDDAKSIILSLMLVNNHNATSAGTDPASPSTMPKITGWERNSSGRVMSRIANLGEYMDPQR